MRPLTALSLSLGLVTLACGAAPTNEGPPNDPPPDSGTTPSNDAGTRPRTTAERRSSSR